MSQEVKLEDALRKGSWAQFQFYGLLDRPVLLIVGGILDVAVVDGRLTCDCDRQFRSLGDDIWEAVRDPTAFVVPGDVRGLRVWHTGTGRLVILFAHPSESVVTVLFPEGDDGHAEELCRDTEMNPLDLAEIAACARQPQTLEP